MLFVEEALQNKFSVEFAMSLVCILHDLLKKVFIRISLFCAALLTC